MKGLLIKDFALLGGQKKFLLTVIIIAAVMAVMSSNIPFIFGYSAFSISMFSLSTIGYDEFENGNAFLFTLPITRKLYVVEKYLFTLILAACALAFSCILSLCIMLYDKSLSFPSITFLAVTLGILAVSFSFLLPLQFKFGSEKGRIAMLAFCVVIFVLYFAFSKLAEHFEINLVKLVYQITSLNVAVIAMCATALFIAVVLISVCISIKIMKKKEF